MNVIIEALIEEFTKRDITVIRFDRQDGFIMKAHSAKYARVAVYLKDGRLKVIVGDATLAHDPIVYFDLTDHGFLEKLLCHITV